MFPSARHGDQGTVAAVQHCHPLPELSWVFWGLQTALLLTGGSSGCYCFWWVLFHEMGLLLVPR